MIGGLQLSSCCANPAPDAEVPSCPFTQIRCEYLERQTFIASFLPVVFSTYTSSHPGCQPPSRIVNWYTPMAGLFNGVYGTVCRYDVNARATAEAIWTKSTEQVLSGSNGAILRDGTNIVIATASFRYKRTTFSLSSRTRTATNGVVVSGTVTRDGSGVLFDCCTPENAVTETWDIISQGAPVTNNSPTAQTTMTVDWAGICNQQVIGLRLTRTATGPATSPWKVDVIGGVVRLTDVNNTVYEYSGLLNTVRTQIQNDGYFTVTIGPIQTTVAHTSDLLPVSNEPVLNGCPRSLLVADVGDPIAPGSAGFGGQVRVTSGAYIEYFDSTASGFSNSIAGAFSWLNRPRYPKLITVEALGNFESTFFSYLGLSSRWLDVPGESLITEDQFILPNGPGDDRTDYVDTVDCVACVSNSVSLEDNPCYPCPPPGGGTGGIFPVTRTINYCPDRVEVGFSDCFGGIVEDVCGNDCNPTTPDRYLTVCISREQTTTPIVPETLTYTLTQRMQGSFTFS
jgi:hypothetical protein